MVPEAPRAVLGSLQVIVDQDDGGSDVGSVFVRPRSQNLRASDSLWKFQDYEWPDEVRVRETLSALTHSLGIDLAKRLAYRL